MSNSSSISKAGTTTLDQLKVGDAAMISDVTLASEDKGAAFNLTRRLKELGFIKGEPVKLLHRGYFGGEPLAVRIGQSTFALRQFEAALIQVQTPGFAE